MNTKLLFRALLRREGLEEEFLTECGVEGWEAFFNMQYNTHDYVSEAFVWHLSEWEEVWEWIDREWSDILEEAGYEEHLSNP